MGKLHIRVVHAPAITTTTTEVHTLTEPSPAYQPGTGGQTFTGNGSENIGTINVHRSSELRWSCPSCANNNFTIDNSGNDAGTITVNALGPSSGKTFMDAGSYHDVTIGTEGQAWTITITPG